MAVSFAIVTLAAAVIWWFSDRLQGVAHVIGRRLRMPDSVKGAVLYAIPSSFPELCTAVMAVIALDEPVFDVGVGTIAGSAVFNILVIPALSILVAAAYLRRKGEKLEAIHISPHVFVRDGLFYLAIILVFVTVVVVNQSLSPLWAGVFLGLYGVYVFILYRDTKRHREGSAADADDDEAADMSFALAIVWLLVSVAVLGVACYFLVEHTIEISRHLGVNPYVVAVILTAAATSIPDTLISVAAAKKAGADAEEAIVNAFSSNIFDVLVCLSVPVLLYGGTIDISVSENIVNLVLLVVVTVVTLVVIKIGNSVTKAKGWFLLGLYALFVASALFNNPILEFLGVDIAPSN